MEAYLLKVIEKMSDPRFWDHVADAQERWELERGTNWLLELPKKAKDVEVLKWQVRDLKEDLNEAWDSETFANDKLDDANTEIRALKETIKKLSESTSGQ